MGCPRLSSLPVSQGEPAEALRATPPRVRPDPIREAPRVIRRARVGAQPARAHVRRRDAGDVRRARRLRRDQVRRPPRDVQRPREGRGDPRRARGGGAPTGPKRPGVVGDGSVSQFGPSEGAGGERAESRSCAAHRGSSFSA